MIQTMKASAVREEWSQILGKVFRGNRVLVEKSGIPVAAIISAGDLERLTELESQGDRDFAVLDEMRAAFKDVSPEEIEKEVNKAVNEVRAENRLKKAPKMK